MPGFDASLGCVESIRAVYPDESLAARTLPGPLTSEETQFISERGGDRQASSATARCGPPATAAQAQE
ncbi:MAG TPA: hypothetical protein VMK12_22460 [Anaeromyxobacteraceae bacterium]|nr:hypothetical protein [Anaeromyxobacteraceae bacterium]